MNLLKKNIQMEDEFSLLPEMEMLHVYGGEEGINITNENNCTVNGEIEDINVINENNCTVNTNTIKAYPKKCKRNNAR